MIRMMRLHSSCHPTENFTFLFTVLISKVHSLHTKLCLEGARLVVDASVDYTAVVTALMDT